MTVDEVRRVITAAGEFDALAALALRLAAVAGLRRGEIAALRWDDLDGDRLTIDKSAEVVRTGERGKPIVRTAETKTANRRRIRLDPKTVEEIDALRGERERDAPFMFSLGEEPAPPARVGWWWSRARELAGIDRRWRLHDLRHWAATMAIAGGHDIPAVSARLGHANPGITLRVYSHALPSGDAPLAATLAGVLDTEESSVLDA